MGFRYRVGQDTSELPKVFRISDSLFIYFLDDCINHRGSEKFLADTHKFSGPGDSRARITECDKAIRDFEDLDQLV